MTGPLAALRGAVAFLTRVPVGQRDGDWVAFRTTPATFPIVGALVGALAAIPLLAAGTLPAPSVAVGYAVAVYAVTGINHLDGVADLGDAAVVHGNAERRLQVTNDTITGVGALCAVALVVSGLVLGALGLAGLPPLAAVGVAVAAEVGAKLGMVLLACFGRASHEGYGSSLTEPLGPGALVLPAALALPAAALTWPHPAAAAALAGALVGALGPWWWARRNLGGVSGDVFGAANEIGRVLGVHAGVIAWTLY